MPSDLSDILLYRRRRRGGPSIPAWLLLNPDDNSLPALDIDFANNRAWLNNSVAAIPDILTCTRASGGYYTNADGSMTWFGSNTLRYGDRGLLSEAARTNVFLNSAAPVTQNITVTAQAYTLSFYGTGTITLSGASTAGPLTASGGSTDRVSLTFTPTAGTLTLTVSGSPEKVQLEAGSFATSYIPTTSSSATRAADTTSLTDFDTNLGMSSLTTVVSRAELRDVGAGVRAVWHFSDGTAANRIRVSGINGSSGCYAFCQTGGVTQYSISAGSISSDTAFKVATALATDDIAHCVDGGGVGTDISATLPIVDRLLIGAGDGAWSAVHRLTVFKGARISNSGLQALTS